MRESFKIREVWYIVVLLINYDWKCNFKLFNKQWTSGTGEYVVGTGWMESEITSDFKMEIVSSTVWGSLSSVIRFIVIALLFLTEKLAC